MTALAQVRTCRPRHLTETQAPTLCGFFFATVGILRTGFLEDLALGFFDSISAKLRRIWAIRSGVPLAALVGAGCVGMRLPTAASIILRTRSWYRSLNCVGSNSPS